MYIEIEPFDTLFFRNGKPYDAGYETYGECMFPPYPSVIYGALRTVYFSNNPEELCKANTYEDPTVNLRVKGIYYKTEKYTCLPIPYDLMQIKNKSKEQRNKENFLKEYDTVSLKYRKLIGQTSAKNISGTLGYKEEVEDIPDGLIDCGSFEDYISGFTDGIKVIRFRDHASSEYKTIIKIDRRLHASEETKLCQMPMTRLKDISICVEFEGLKIPEKGIIKLGGEGKAAKYRVSQFYSIKKPKIGSKYFKLYISTPAVFKNGWIPGWINKDTMQGEYAGLKVKLLTASIGKYIYIGGFDMKRNCPKPMKRAVPAGSVYYFEILDGNSDMAVELFHGKSVSEFDTAIQGFGISYVGKFREEEIKL